MLTEQERLKLIRMIAEGAIQEADVPPKVLRALRPKYRPPMPPAPWWDDTVVWTPTPDLTVR